MLLIRYLSLVSISVVSCLLCTQKLSASGRYVPCLSGPMARCCKLARPGIHSDTLLLVLKHADVMTC